MTNYRWLAREHNRHARLVRDTLATPGVSGTAKVVLVALAVEGGPLSVAQLTWFTGVDGGNTRRAVTRLAAAGWITRDGRRWRLVPERVEGASQVLPPAQVVRDLWHGPANAAHPLPWPDTRQRVPEAEQDTRERASGAEQDTRERASGAEQDTRERASGAEQDTRERASEAEQDTPQRVPAGGPPRLHVVTNNPKEDM
jgi:hypothetical protein